MEAENPQGGSNFQNSLEVASFCPSMPHLAVTATLAGTITIWDINSRVRSQLIWL